MNIRRINESEILKVCKAGAVSFDYPFNKEEKGEEELLKEILKNPEYKSLAYWRDNWGAFDENGELLSCLAVIPYTFQFDGNKTKGAGIGGVCTYPQHRRKGAVRALFQEALMDMYDKDVIFSYLYPFSESFYRKFGYEKAVNSLVWDFDLRFIPVSSYKGTFSLYDKGEISAEFKSLYEAFAAKHNLMIHRDDYDWSVLKNAKGAINNTYAYLYRGENKEPKGYVIFNKEAENNISYLRSQEIIFDSFETLKAILGLLSTYAADFPYLRTRLPEWYNMRYFCSDYVQSQSNISYISDGMVRAVNVREILKMAAYKGEGELNIRITDEQIKNNSSTFKVLYKNGKAEQVEENVKTQADIEMPVSVFSAAITGSCKAEDFLFMDEVCMRCSVQKASEVFYKKPSWIVNFF